MVEATEGLDSSSLRVAIKSEFTLGNYSARASILVTNYFGSVSYFLPQNSFLSIQMPLLMAGCA